MNAERWLPGVPGAKIEAMLNQADGQELASGKFDNPDSSANAFGFFLERPAEMPPLPGCENDAWPAVSVKPEQKVCFPWSRGKHPNLDVLVVTPTALIGVESKRFEPFRTRQDSAFSDAYWRDVWGGQMDGYQAARDHNRRVKESGRREYSRLDRAQLVKHALALRTQVQPGGRFPGRRPVLYYIYAESDAFAKSGDPIAPDAKAQHRREIAEFAAAVANDEVAFVSCTYRQLLAHWQQNDDPEIAAHAARVMERFAP